MKYLPFGGVTPLTKKPEDSGYEIGVPVQLSVRGRSVGSSPEQRLVIELKWVVIRGNTVKAR